ncbi:beta-alanine-activating enzyme [Nephila pilipes]|uniref:Beta-alanine-activating enzyme n=1 Tax=Nephila pilipes TaxID=299642 RepID=A0A8X6NE40_NEPPI|nr:beta-alanine-activating enzyme [Nephila pilipes]
MDEIKLYDLYLNKNAFSFNVIFNDFKSKQSLNYKQNHIYVCEVAELLNTASATNSIIGCIVKPGLQLPAIILGILKVSSAFIFLDIHEPCVSLQNVQNCVPIVTLLVEEPFLKDLNKNLCNCWLEKSKIKFGSFSSLVLLQSSDCSNSSCLNSKQLHSNSFKYISKLAYVIQTSGTTGKPKIVQVPHQCIVPNIVDLKQTFNVNSEDVMILCSPLTFDPSIVEIFLAISSGCSLIIVPEQMKSIPKMFINVIVDNKVSILQATPSLIQSFGNDFIENVLLSNDSNLHVLAFGGEPCPSLEKLKRWKSKENKTKLFNLYGLTEVSCWASCFEIDLGDKSLTSNIPLGKPLLDTDIEVTKEGELYIGGEKRWCVINNETWPHDRCKIMCSTGDMAIRMPNNVLYFEGRKDDIIKFNGQKLSLLRINTLLEDVHGMSNYYLHFDNESSKLLLFIVQDSRTNFSENLRHYVLKYLQKSISNLPAIEMIIVTHIPLTKHGKADRKKLLLLRHTKDLCKKNYLPLSHSECLEIICKLWKSYTKQYSIAETDNFVLNGGDSILALQLASDIEWELQVQIPQLLDMILNFSYKDLCEIVENNLREVQKLKIEDQRSISISIDKLFHESPPKRVCTAVTECFEVVSRRGYSLRCSHSKDRTCNNKIICDKLLDSANVSFRIKCKFDLKKCVDSSPCVAYFFRSSELLVFIGSHAGLFCCFNVSETNINWTINFPDRIESSSCLSFCGKYVYVGCYDHHLYCMNVKDGSIKWQFKTGSEVKSSPVVSSQNAVFVGSHDKYLYAVNGESGDLLWKKIIAQGSIFSSPSLFEELGAVTVATLDGILAVLKMVSVFNLKKCYDHHLYCMNVKDGSIKWQFKTGSEVKSSPVVSSQNAVFVGSHDKYLYAVNGESGDLLWKKIIAQGSIFSSPSLFEELGAVTVATLDGILAVLKMDSGDFIWTYNYKKPLFSSPLFTSSGIFIGATNNCFLHFNISGSLILEYETNGPIFSSACAILNNDHIVFGCHDSFVYCVKVNGESVWKFCSDSPVYSTPFAFQWKQCKYVTVASVSGVIYILDQISGEVKHSWKCPGEIFSSPTVLNGFLVVGCRDNYVYCFSLCNVG